MELTQERLDKFKQVISSLEADVNIIISLSDPDALGSAPVLRNIMIDLLAGQGNEINVYLCGDLGHQQNKNIIAALELEGYYKPIEVLLEKEQIFNVVLVDSSSLNDNKLPEKLREVRPVIIIDHHKSDMLEMENEFFWLDDVGSACTMIAELAQMLDHDFSSDKHPLDAMLLTAGMHNDTDKLVNYCKRTAKQIGILSDFVKPELMPQLLRTPYGTNYLSYLALALQNRRQEGDRLVTNIGFVEGASGGGYKVQIADFLLEQQGFSTVIVWEAKKIDNNKIRLDISSRGKDSATIFLHDFMKEKFNGGAQKSGNKGGAQIDFDFSVLSPNLDKLPSTKQKMIEFLQTYVEEISFNDDL